MAESESFWKRRAQTLENERNNLLQRLDELAELRKAARQAEWEKLDWQEEVKKLQAALREAHSYLYDERSRLLGVQQENDRLRRLEAEQRRKVHRVLELANLPKEHADLPEPHTDDATDALLQQVQSLQAQLDEHKQLAADRVNQLVEDQREREAEEEKIRKQAQRRERELIQKLRHTEDMLHNAIRESHQQKRHSDDTLQAAEQRKSEAEQKEQAAFAQKRQQEELLQERASQMQKENEDFVNSLREQLNRKDAEASGFEASYNTAMQRVNELESQLASAKQAKKATEQKRARDLEGLQNDIMHMRKQVNSVDLRVHAAQLNDRLSARKKVDELAKSLQAYKSMDNKSGSSDGVAFLHARRPGAPALASEVTKLRQELDEAERKVNAQAQTV